MTVVRAALPLGTFSLPETKVMKLLKKISWPQAAVTIGVIVCVLVVGGCLDAVKRSEVEKHSLEAARLVKVVDAKISEVQSELAKDTTPDKLRELSARLDKYKEDRERVVKAAETFEAHAENGDVLGGVVAAAAPWMGPYGGIAVAATPLLLGLLNHLSQKQKQKEQREAAVAAIRNVDSIVRDPSVGGPTGTVNFDDHEVRAKLRELDMATPGTLELVAEAVK